MPALKRKTQDVCRKRAPRRVAPRVTMENVIGPAAATAHEALRDPTAHLHLYGKTQAPEGRKMGHITRLEWPEEEPAR